MNSAGSSTAKGPWAAEIGEAYARARGPLKAARCGTPEGSQDAAFGVVSGLAGSVACGRLRDKRERAACVRKDDRDVGMGALGSAVDQIARGTGGLVRIVDCGRSERSPRIAAHREHCARRSGRVQVDNSCTLVEERPQRLKRGIPWESGVSLSVRRKHPDAHRAELVECALRLRVTQEGGEMRRTSKSDLARE